MADDILAGAKERLSASQDGSVLNRDEALNDIAFSRLALQWPREIMTQRRLEGRPCLVVNRLPAFIRQVVNDARQNRPGISVHPVDSGADYKTAQIIGGLIRAIERGSNAEVAYNTALENAVTGGFGFFRVCTDYVHSESFDMEARIERIANPLAVYWDVTSTAFDASDWEYGFVTEWMEQAEFKKRYPKASPVDFNGGFGDYDRNWIDGRNVRVAEYWLRSEEKQKLFGFADGTTLTEKALHEQLEVMASGLGIEAPEKADDGLRLLGELTGMVPTRERSSNYFKVKRRMVSGVEVLEETDWAGQSIPICPVWGEEVMYQGRRHFRGMVRDARGPQEMLNYWRSSATELIALAPKAPWLVPQGAIPDTERQKWNTANVRSYSYLEYDATAGQMPQRQPFAGVPAGALQEALNSIDDIKSITGIHDASLGARSNETSGRAILARQREGDTANYHFIGNLARAVEYCARVLIEIIPSVYSTRQAIQILGQDDAPQVVRLQQSSGRPAEPDGENGRLYSLDVGKYDVTVKVGPSYATQREEARESLLEIMRAVPQSALVIGDLILKNMDFPEADEAAKRIQMLQQIELQKMMPPAVPPGAPGQAQGMGGPPPVGAPPVGA